MAQSPINRPIWSHWLLRYSKIGIWHRFVIEYGLLKCQNFGHISCGRTLHCRLSRRHRDVSKIVRFVALWDIFVVIFAFRRNYFLRKKLQTLCNVQLSHLQETLIKTFFNTYLDKPHIAQWVRLCLPSCGTGSIPKHNIYAFQFDEERTKINTKRPGLNHLKKLNYSLLRLREPKSRI